LERDQAAPERVTAAVLQSVAREIAELAPNAELVMEWKEPAVVPRTVERVREFLRPYIPAKSAAARS
jgi:hypothetical protein